MPEPDFLVEPDGRFQDAVRIQDHCMGAQFPGRAFKDTSGMVYEDKLPLIQERLKR